MSALYELNDILNSQAQVAQLVKRQTSNLGVPGSMPGMLKKGGMLKFSCTILKPIYTYKNTENGRILMN